MSIKKSLGDQEFMSLASLITQYLPPYAVCKELTNLSFKSLQILPPTSGLNLSIYIEHNSIEKYQFLYTIQYFYAFSIYN